MGCRSLRPDQTRVLVSGATVTAAAAVTDGLLPSSAPPLLLIALAAATGLFTPPLAGLRAAAGVTTLAASSRLPAAAWWIAELGDDAALALILFGTGVAFGATEVGVTAAAPALGSAAAAGPVLGNWGVGSLLGGIAATRLGGAQGAKGLTLLLAALALAHAALILTTGSMVAIGAVIVLAGATIAPTVSSIYAMVDAAAPAGTRTEAFSWALTASLTGSALGAAGAGAVAQSAGATAAFALAGAAGAVAVLTAILRSPSFEPSSPNMGPEPRAPRASRHPSRSDPPARHTQIRTHTGVSVNGLVATADTRPASRSMPVFVPGRSHGHPELIENRGAVLVIGRTSFDATMMAAIQVMPTTHRVDATHVKGSDDDRLSHPGNQDHAASCVRP
jgi:hypothetical protein